MIHQTIETFDGSTAFKKDCRFIKGEFYIKNKQCFLINGTWYRVNSGFIVYDNEKKEWVVQKENPGLVKGIIGYDAEKKDVILGYYTPDPYKNVQALIPNGSTLNAISLDILPSGVFVEDPYRMIFVHKGLTPSLGYSKSSAPVVNFSSNGYPFGPPYCCKHYDKALALRFETGAKDAIRSLSGRTNISSYYGVLGKQTFGLEFETNKGKIPNYKVLSSGLMPLRDGSINGIEFATIVLSGKQGVTILEDACDLLRKHTNFTENESLHLHIGNIPTTKQFIAYLYTLCCILEKDVYSIFPRYYAKTSQFKVRGKDYNMPLRKELCSNDMDETFENLAFYLGAGKKYQGFGSEHPSDPDGSHKWGINERYHWVNFIPLLFGGNKTLEFRCHVPTQDPVKVINWLYICSAIIQAAAVWHEIGRDLSSMKKTTLADCVKEVYGSKLASYLCNYISARKTNREKDDLANDFIGAREIKAELSGNVQYGDI